MQFVHTKRTLDINIQLGVQRVLHINFCWIPPINLVVEIINGASIYSDSLEDNSVNVLFGAVKIKHRYD